MMDLDWLRRLVRLVEESEIDSLEVERWATRVRIRKSPEGAGGPALVSAAPPRAASAPPAVPPAAAEAAPAGGEGEAEGGEVGESDLFEVTSPMVGTFYRAPAPDAEPFVKVGGHVEQGQTLCILEAMKLMNELESEISGTIREIAVQNAEPVEYGQLLFRIDPD